MRITSLVLLLVATPALAASPSDFFCNEQPLQMPAFVKVHQKSCDGKDVTEENICTEIVKCAYITPAIKDEAKKALKKDFSQLSYAEKKQFIQDSSSVEFFQSVLTCKGARQAPSDLQPLDGICPTPENCKGDVFYKMGSAAWELDQLGDFKKRQDKGTLKIIQPAASEGAHEAGVKK